jgi:hypothetical protein
VLISEIGDTISELENLMFDPIESNDQKITLLSIILKYSPSHELLESNQWFDKENIDRFLRCILSFWWSTELTENLLTKIQAWLSFFQDNNLPCLEQQTTEKD